MTDPDAALARLRAIALQLPGAAEKVSHSQPCFHVEGGDAFAYLRHDHHGDGETAVLVRTGDADEQAMLLEAEPALYYRPSYLGPSGWIAIRVAADDTDWDHVGDRVSRSWELAAPARLLEAGGR